MVEGGLRLGRVRKSGPCQVASPLHRTPCGPPPRPGEDEMGLIDIPPGHIGAVVTFLEMIERPRARVVPEAPLQLVRWRAVEAEKYRLLFERVGAKWLWYSRLAMDEATLLANVAEVHAVVDRRRIEVGMIELDFRSDGECLIRFLGLVPELAGRGHGKWLLDRK